MPFRKGVSGNPGGRPKDKPFADALRTEIKAAGNHKALRRVARALIDKAEGGDLAAIRELADRLDGRVPQAVSADLTEVPEDPFGELIKQIQKSRNRIGPFGRENRSDLEAADVDFPPRPRSDPVGDPG